MPQNKYTSTISNDQRKINWALTKFKKIEQQQKLGNGNESENISSNKLAKSNIRKPMQDNDW